MSHFNWNIDHTSITLLISNTSVQRSLHVSANSHKSQTLFHPPPHRLRVSNSKSCPFQIEVTGRTELDETGEQVTALFFRLCDSMMDHSGVTASAAKLWQRRGICKQADPIFHVENAHARGGVIDLGDAKV